MAPKPPKIRPRPAKTENTTQPAQHTRPARSPKVEVKKPLAQSHPVKQQPVQAAPQPHRVNPLMNNKQGRIPPPRVVHIENGIVIDSSQAAKRDHAEIKTQAHRPMIDQSGTTPRELANKAIKNRPGRLPRQFVSMVAERKFVAKEGAMTGEDSGVTTERDTVYWTPLGGLEEVGRNCSFFEYNDEIVILDMGIQFPEEDTPGVDWIIPNMSYLEKKKKNIKGILITHAHYDHFGAVPYVLEKLGNPVIYGTALIRELLKKRLDEMPNAPKLRFEVIKNHTRSKLSEHFTVEFFGVAHTVPDTTGVVVETPIGKIVHFADFRLEYDKNGNAFNLDEYKWLGTQNVHSLMIDSTNAHQSGHTVSEELVIENLEKLFLQSEGRIILSTFASMIERLAEIIRIAEKIGRYVVINGRSMKDNLEIARQLGYLSYKNGSLVPVEEVAKYPDHKLLIITTGAQGQENAGLMRIINGEHRHIKIKPTDTAIFSSSVIPGNERSVQTVKDNLVRQGATVHTNNDLDIHSSGHCPGPDLALVAQMCKPKFIIPVHGYIFQRAANIPHMKAIGIGRERVILADNGQMVKFTPEDIKITEKHVDASYVMVDGLGVGDVEAVVLRDRKLLAQEGMLVIIVTINKQTGKLIKNPDIISRGFIYLKDNGALIDEMRGKIRNLVNQVNQSHAKQEAENDYIKSLLRDQIGLYLYNKTLRRPMILPVLIEV
jgi:ribonuclease J